MTALSQLLDTYRNAAASEREKGTYFEELMLAYLRNEASYRDLGMKPDEYPRLGRSYLEAVERLGIDG